MVRRQGQENPREPLSIALCGDVMMGRGIDQVLPHPGNPRLYESYLHDARAYVELAERVSGPIPRPVDVIYPWGEAADALKRFGPDAWIINLEMSVTSREEAWPDKGIHYRMHPANIAGLSAIGSPCCCLANNHVLDWGTAGLLETLQTLDGAGSAHAGAGRHAAEAAAPAVIGVPGKGRVRVFSLGTPTSGIPGDWAAGRDRPGIQVLEDLSETTARRLATHIQAFKHPQDVVVASIHWGANWVDAVPDAHIRFAHELVDGGVDVVHGHSSHHVMAIEVYREHLILYGCGDFLDDYEGIRGYEEYHPNVRMLYLLRIDPRRGRLVQAKLVPLQMSRFRLQRASDAEVGWAHQRLNELGSPFGTSLQRDPENHLILHWR